MGQSSPATTGPSLAEWAKTQDTSVEELKILVAAQGVLDWDTYCGKFEDVDVPLDNGRQTALSGMLQKNRAIAIKVPLDTIAAVTGLDEHMVRRAALLPDYADAVDSAGKSILSTELHEFLGCLDAIRNNDQAFVHTLPQLQNGVGREGEPPSGGEGPDPTGIPPEQPDDPGESSRPEGGAEEDPAGQPPDDRPADWPGTPPAQSPPPARKSAGKGEPKAKKPRLPKTKYSVAKSDLDKMLRPATDQSFDTRKIREFLMALPEYKPQDIALMLDDEAIRKFREDYVSVNLPAGNMILSHQNYQALLDLLNGSVYMMPEQETEP